MLIFSVLDRKYPFSVKFCPKNWNCQLKPKFGTKTNSSMQNSMVGLTFFGFDQNYFFWANFVQTIKIVTLSWNLVPRLIEIYRIQWWSHLCCQMEIPFFRKFGSKIQNCFLKVKVSAKTNSNMQNSMLMFTFSVFYQKDLFELTWSKKIKNWQFQLKFDN